jgi:diphosphomevalonate decarboxylase
VDKGAKQISSTVGHNLMHDHPFAKERFRQANDNLGRIIDILESGNLIDFAELVESEALTLHAMMLTSSPSFILMRPNTLEIIRRIRKFRTETKTNLCFTLDAGANVHVLYPDSESEQVFEFIKNELAAFCENGHFISDRMGSGAKLIVHY